LSFLWKNIEKRFSAGVRCTGPRGGYERGLCVS
jgi:hypothetical protein